MTELDRMLAIPSSYIIPIVIYKLPRTSLCGMNYYLCVCVSICNDAWVWVWVCVCVHVWLRTCRVRIECRICFLHFSPTIYLVATRQSTVSCGVDNSISHIGHFNSWSLWIITGWRGARIHYTHTHNITTNLPTGFIYIPNRHTYHPPTHSPIHSSNCSRGGISGSRRLTSAIRRPEMKKMGEKGTCLLSLTLPSTK